MALLIGGQEVISVLADKLNITTGPIGWISQLDLNYVGFAIVTVFTATWILALTIWHLSKIDRRWSGEIVPPSAVRMAGRKRATRFGRPLHHLSRLTTF